jgi:hypothetical protein
VLLIFVAARSANSRAKDATRRGRLSTEKHSILGRACRKSKQPG